MSLVSVDWLADRLGDPTLRVIDARWYLTDPDQGGREYAEAHIPGAVFFDLERELSDLSRVGEGRHPLPDPTRLAKLFGAHGIGSDHRVVAYDAGNGAIAARAWWLLRHLGHRGVSVLDGGMAGWLADGHATTDSVPAFPPATLAVTIRDGDTVDMEGAANPGRAILLDARAPERYRGEFEPADPVAGHIPGAVNLPFASLVDADQRLLPAAELADRFAAVGVDQSSEVIASCGSGVTACHLILAAVVAGLPEPRLYPGSYSQWTRADRPVET